MSVPTPAARRGLSLSVKQRLYALVGALLALWLLSAGVAILGLNQGLNGAHDLSNSFDEANQGSEAYTHWLTQDGAINMAVLLQGLNDPTQQKLLDETWAVAVDESRSTNGK